MILTHQLYVACALIIIIISLPRIQNFVAQEPSLRLAVSQVALSPNSARAASESSGNVHSYSNQAGQWDIALIQTQLAICWYI